MPRGRTGTSLSLPALHWRGRELDQLTSEGESPDLLHLEGCLSTDLRVQAQAQVTRQPLSGVGPHRWARAGGVQILASSGQLQVAIQAHHRRTQVPPPRTHPHTRAAGHAHADLRVPVVQEAGGGGFECSESRLLPKSIGILSSPLLSPPPPPRRPHLRLGCRGHSSRCGHPPNSLTSGCLLFHNLSQRLGLGDQSPCLPPAPTPAQWCSASPAPFYVGEKGAYVWVGSFSLSAGVCLWSVWDCDSPGRDKA